MQTDSQFYICEKYYLLIYETKDMAAVAFARRTAAAAAESAAGSAWWSKELNSRGLCSNPNEPIFLIKSEGKYWNVIIGERIGWIIMEDWLNIKELINDRK